MGLPVLGPSPRVLRPWEPPRGPRPGPGSPAPRGCPRPANHSGSAAPLSGAPSLPADSSFSGLTAVVQSLPWELADNVTDPGTSQGGQRAACQGGGRVWMGALHFQYTGSFRRQADKLSPRLAPTLNDHFPYQERQAAKQGLW